MTIRSLIISDNSNGNMEYVVCKIKSVFSYKLRYIVGLRLVEMNISTNPKPVIYRNLYENAGPDPYRN